MRRSVALVFLFSMVVSAGPFINGSFETGPDLGVLVQMSLPEGSTDLTGWLVLGDPNNGLTDFDMIDYVGSFWTPSDGVRSLDLNGNFPGGIVQTFDTIIGQTYEVLFDMAGNPGGGGTLRTMDVSAGGTSAGYSFDVTGRTELDMGWVTRSFVFTASGAASSLTFQSTTFEPNTGSVFWSFGPALDNVRVAPIPEPSTAAFLLLGLAGLAGWRKLRR